MSWRHPLLATSCLLSASAVLHAASFEANFSGAGAPSTVSVVQGSTFTLTVYGQVTDPDFGLGGFGLSPTFDSTYLQFQSVDVASFGHSDLAGSPTDANILAVVNPLAGDTFARNTFDTLFTVTFKALLPTPATLVGLQTLGPDPFVLADPPLTVINAFSLGGQVVEITAATVIPLPTALPAGLVLLTGIATLRRQTRQQA